MPVTSEAGLRAEEIHRGTPIGGRRVAAISTGIRNGQRVILVRFDGHDRKGRPRLSDPVTYHIGAYVPGTRRPTTWAMPAGPVGRKPGGRANGGWWGDGDDGKSGASDRHQRRVESFTYAD